MQQDLKRQASRNAMDDSIETLLKPPPAPATASLRCSEPQQPRDNWGNSLEFLMSCIALSVGLGNVWRFPFTALENGGGAFLIPYLVVLLLVGKPIYYMEMLLGQFSSRGIVQVFDLAPLMRGVGYAQLLSLAVLATYYAAIMALTLRYFFDSFATLLPWSYCRDEWGSGCVSAAGQQQHHLQFGQNFSSSTQLYLQRIVLNETETLEQGIGYPSGNLSLMLALSWLTVTLIIIRGVRSSGKASYVLALFPYVVMLILLVRALSLPGAYNGVMYFLTPQWDKLLEPVVWYNAVTQVFFSLAICFGVIIMYSSYNRFGHNIYRDAHIVTGLDTFTSLLSGVIIFGILGKLAHESGTKDIASVVKAGPGLAFISYPEAIAKFKLMPQVFSLLFFLMLFLLGVGSNVGMVSCIMSVLKDRFVHTKLWLIVLCISLLGFLVGLLYITPGGQHIVTLLDFHGVTFVSLVAAIFELIAVGWVYVTPLVMIVILVYTLCSMRPLSYNGQVLPLPYRVFGWCLSGLITGQLLYWACYAIHQQPAGSLGMRIRQAMRPLADWGPLEAKQLQDYQLFRAKKAASARPKDRRGLYHSFVDHILS
ncbi:CG4476 [Drosophila busckii]|uniref:Transporter n=1 Tax=Drosophila busckii TaxID=30019 RepID=A0A0M4EGN5_DROBS|nr:CG4476 [Drosophila busckii]